MKTHLKKALSVFLSVLMVLSCWVWVAPESHNHAHAAEVNNTVKNKYLFAYFTDNSSAGQTIHLAVSEDGLHYTALRNNDPVIVPSKGTGAVRDPYLWYNEQDNYYYIIATDMDASNNQWWDNCNGFIMWRSKDLVHWYDETFINVYDMLQRFDEPVGIVHRAWAPQIMWDGTSYVIYFSIDTDNVNYPADQLSIVYLKTTDLMNLDAYYEYGGILYPGYDVNDADIIQHPTTGKWHLFYKPENGNVKINMLVSDSATGPYTSPDATNSAGLDVFSTVNEALEGGNGFFDHNGNFVLYADAFGHGTSYFYVATTPATGDFKNWTVYGESAHNINSLSPRHGSVIPITTDEYNRLLNNAYGITSSSFPANETLADHLIARYFTTADPTYNAETGKNDLTLHGNQSVGTDMLDTIGYYVNFDGNTMYGIDLEEIAGENFNADDGFTITFTAKATSGQNSRFYEIADNFGQQTDGVSHYTHFSPAGGSGGAYIGNYNGPSGVAHRAQSASKQYNDGQVHEWIVSYANGNTIVYCDGEMIIKMNRFDNAGTNDDAWYAAIRNATMYIGQSGWTQDPMFTGWISDFCIYDCSMSYYDVKNIQNEQDIEAGLTGSDGVSSYNGFNGAVPSWTASSVEQMKSLEGFAFDNILYSPNVSGMPGEEDNPTTSNGAAAADSDSGFYFGVYYAKDTVIYLDGETIPKIPVYAAGRVGENRKDGRLTQIYPINSTSDTSENKYFYLVDTWKGWNASSKYHEGIMNPDANAAEPVSTGHNASTTGNCDFDDTNSGTANQSQRDIRYIANILQLNENQVSVNSAGYQKINLAWHFTYDWQEATRKNIFSSYEWQAWQTGRTKNLAANNNNIWVIDLRSYVAAKNEIAANYDSIVTDSAYCPAIVESYKDVVAEIMKFNPSSYSYAGGVESAVSTCSTQAKNLVNDYNKVIAELESHNKGHKTLTVPGRDATCAAPGLSDGSYCEYCGKIFVEQVITDIVPHTYGDVYTVDGIKYVKCTVCGVEIKYVPYEVRYENIFDIEKWTYSASNQLVGAGTISADEKKGTITIVNNHTGEVYSRAHFDGQNLVSTRDPGNYAVPVTGGRKYIIEATTLASSTSQGEIFVFQYDKDGKVFSSIARNFALNAGETVSKEFTVDPAAAYIELRFDANTAGGTVTFKDIGIYETEEKRTFFYPGESKPLLEPTLKEGYAFDGWYTKSGAKIDDTSDLSAPVNFVYAKYVKGYKITFINAAGETVLVKNYAEGTTPTVPATNTAADYDETNHYKYSWPTPAKVIGDATYNEIKTPTAHTMSSSVTTAPTCTGKGVKTYTCSGCAYTYTEEITATGHTEEIIPAVEATCSTPGKTEGKRCSVCNTVLVAQTEIPVKDHTIVIDAAVDATCTTPGKTEGKHCSVCNTVIVAQTEIPVKAHTEVVDAAVAATCTTPGKTEGKHCSVCNTVLVAQTEVPATGHTEVVDAAVSATCTTPGKTEGKHCSVCNTVLVAQTTVPAKGHTEETIPAVPSTCTTPGKTEGKKCTVCGTVTVAPQDTALASHTPAAAVEENRVESTCTVAGSYDSVVYCSVCNYKISSTKVDLPLAEHTKGETKVENEVAPSCTKEGSYDNVVYCTKCNAEISRDKVTVGVVAHTEADAVEENRVESTCTVAGSYDSVVKCSVCGEELSRTKVDLPLAEHKEETIPAVGATCEVPGKTEGTKCSVCDTVLKAQDDVPALGHKYEAKVTTEPGCETAGEKTYTCKNDSTHTYTEVIEATGHKMVAGEVVAPTCTADGYTVYTCANGCGKTENRDVVATEGHKYVAVVTAPTCTAEGYTTHTCSKCDDSYVDTYVDANGHDYKEEVTKNPTCTDKGEKTFTCSVCQHSYTEEIAAAGHQYGEWIEEVAATCKDTGIKGHYECSACHVYFDADKNVIDDLTIEIDAENHTHLTKTDAVAADCENGGNIDYWTCDGCSKIYSDENAETEITAEETKTEKLGHSFTTYESDGNATCTADGTKTAKCDRCDVTDTKEDEGSKLGHEWSETYTSNGDGKENTHYQTCIRENCGVKNDAVAHTWNDGEVTTNPGCTTDGVKTYTCTATGCNATYTEAVAQNGHTNAAAVVEGRVESTCTEAGYYYDVVYCSVCNTEISRTKVDLELAEHTEGEVKVENEKAATCTVDGSYDNVVYCTKCNAELSRETEVVKAEGHKPGAAATCTDPQKCTVCGEVLVDALGHKAAAAVAENKTDATCTVNGKYDSVVYCSVCDEELSRKTEVITAEGHKFSDVTEAKAATCAATGNEAFKSCTVCNKFFAAADDKFSTEAKESADAFTTEKDPDNHAEIVTVDAKAPTCTENGYKAYEHCTKCDYTTYEVDPATDHDYDKTKSEENLTRPVLENGVWVDGYYTYTCKNDSDHTTTENVKRADYTAYDEAVTKLNERLKDTTLIESVENEINSVLSNNTVADNLIETEQATVTAAAENLQAEVDKVYAEYTATFKDWDDEEIAVIEFLYGSQFTNPADPTREADDQYTYTFDKWTPEVDYVTGNLTYTATYKTTVNKYTVTWVIDGVETAETYEYGATPSHEDPEKAADAQYAYTFEGWSPAIATVTGDATYTAQFSETVNKYTVTWVIDGAETTETYEYGATPSHEDPEKAADAQYTYTFEGWSPAIEKVTGNATYTAQFSETVNKYEITWVDGNGETLKTEEVAYGETPVYTGETPTKTATAQYTYTFNNTWTPEISAVTGKATYTAQFDSTVNEYTVTWVVDGASTEETYKYGDTPSFKGTTDKEADVQYTYTFAGWDKDIAEVTGDVTYTAKYDSVVNEYTITFENEDGTVLQSGKVAYGETPVYTGETPTKEKTAEFTYIFDGWTPALEKVTGDKVYTATFEPLTNTYDVTWQNYDGTILEEDKDVKYGTLAKYDGEIPTKPATAEWTYTFDKWDPEVSYVTGDITYTATFTATKNKYTVNFVNEDGTVLQSSEVAYGETPSYTGATPTKAATAEFTYTFDKWTPEITAVTGEATYTAQFSSTVNEYTVTWVVDGVSTEETYKYGATPSHDDPVKEADAQYTYAFTGWSPAIATVTGNATYTAQFSSTVNKYTVKFVDFDGTELKAENVEYGSAATAPADPSREGYTFTGWDKEFGNITGDLTVTAQYKINQYTITFDTDGGSAVAPITQDYATAVTAPTDPTKTGYTFKGWDVEIPSTMPAKDMTITAKWEINKYTITWDVDGNKSTEEYEYGATPSFKGNTDKAADAQYTYTFTGWSPEIADVTADATYTAQYSKTVNKYGLTINYVYADGTTAAPTYTADIDFGVAYSVESPVIEGYTADTAIVTGEMGNEQIVVIVKYTANVYKLTINYINSETNATMFETYTGEFAFGSEYSVTSPSEVGYDVDRSVVDGTMGAGDVAVTVYYTIQKYTITWKNGETVLETDEKVPYGTEPSYDGETPTKPATAEWTYTFDKWTPEVNLVTGDITYTATFTATKNSYTITWKNDDGTVIDTTTVEYGKVPTHADATKENTAEYTYTFAGWTPEIVAVTGDAEYTAQFTETANKYTITVNTVYDDKVDSTTNETATYTYAYGDDYSIEASEKTGYALTTEGTLSGKMPAHDVTITFTYKANSYVVTVNYTSDDNKINETNTVTLTYGEAYNIATPEKIGYTADKAAVAGTVSSDVNETVTYKANSYNLTINYKYADGTEAADAYSTKVVYDTAYSVASPEIKGYTADKPTVAGTMGAADVTVDVTYSVNNYTLTINYVYADGTQAAETYTQTYTFVDTYSVNSPSITGYTADVETVSGDFKDAKNVEATVTYTINVYDVKFVGFNNADLGTQKVEYLGAATAPVAPTVEGYTFTGWDEKFDSITGDLTVTAQYKINQYTITFDTVGGTAIDPIKADFGTAVTAPADPAKTGYTFAGWDTEIPATMPAENVTITAKWNVNQYTITFDTVGGTAIEPIKADFGTAVTAPADPTKTGYTFKGWDVEIPSTMPAENVTITAKWEINKYTITYKADNGTEDIVHTYDYNAEVTAPADPTKTGYTFDGWSPTVPGNMPANDVVVTAQWTINKYTVTFIDNAGNKTEESYDYGTAASAITVPANTVNKYNADGHFSYSWPEISVVTGNAEYKEIETKTAHDYESVVTEPTCTEGGYTTHTCKNEACKHTYKDAETTAKNHDYDMTKSEGNLTRPVQNADGTWTEGKYTFTCKNDPEHKIYETVARADYAAFEEAQKKLEELLNTDLTDEAKANIQTVLDKYADMADDLIATEQGTLDTAVTEITKTFDDNVSALKTYTVTFVANGDVLKTETVVSGKDATAPADPEKAYEDDYHYTFAGWDNGFTNVTADITVTATFTATAHNYETHTDKDDTYHTDKCACGYEKDVEHSYDDGVVTTAPTCSAEGEKLYTCSICNGTKTEVMNKVADAHKWETEYTVDEKASCEKAGSKSYHCEYCDAKNEASVEVIAKREHNIVDTEVATEETCITTGIMNQKCDHEGSDEYEACEYTTTREIPVNASKHTGEKQLVNAKEVTCTTDGYTGDMQWSCCKAEISKGTIIPMLGHKDENTDHTCDNGCGVYQGEHKDSATDADHVCDYGCGAVLEECVDTDKDHACDNGCDKFFGTCADETKDHYCDYGCGKYYGEHEDEDKNHTCDYGCTEKIGTCEDKDLDHDCDYGCDKYFGTHADSAEDDDHVCDYGCGAVLEECVDTDKDHACDNGCDKVFGVCEDADHDHDCDYGCDKYFGIHADSAEDDDHVCDYGCGAVLEECVDSDNNHVCDNGCDKFFGTCEDADYDHACDYGCNKVYGTCEDADYDHACDYGCSKVYGTCEDKDYDHACDYGCDKYFGTHADSAEDDDHVCDYGCGKILEDCSDISGDGDHTCDICSKENVTAHNWVDATCTVAKTCSECSVTEGDALGHDYVGKQTTDPTCTDTGIMTYTCSHDASHTYTETVAALGHTEVIDKAVPATCENTGLTEGKHCSVCSEILVAQTLIAELGHDYVGVVTKDSTCTETGIRTFTCTNDAKHQYTEVIELKAHSIVNVDKKDATCENAGWEAYEYCSTCTYTTFKAIPETGHSFDMANGVLTRPAQLNGEWADGYYTYTCTNDNAHTTTKTVKRADYSEYDSLIDTAEKILAADIPAEDKAKLQETLDKNSVAPDLIESEQAAVDAVLDEIRNVIHDVYPDADLELRIEGNGIFYTGRVIDLDVFKVNESVRIEATDVQWTSSDESIVFFSNGRLIAVGTGTVTLTATSGILKATKTISIIEGGNARKVTFTAMDKMHFVVEDYFVIYNGATLNWSDENALCFRVRIYQNFPFETYIVYINGEAAEPDAEGYYTIPEGTGNVRITISGAVYDDDGNGSSSKFNFWEWLLALLRKIINFFKNLFGIK